MTSVIDNVDEEDNAYSYVIRVAFLLVLACHIPYVFFPAKESLLILFDEAKNKSMTNELQQKLEQAQQHPGAAAHQEAHAEKELAYLKMPAWKYYSLTLTLFSACVAVATVVD